MEKKNYDPQFYLLCSCSLDRKAKNITETFVKGIFKEHTLYLFVQPGTGQAKGFSSPPFMLMELRIDLELMALSVVHDSSLSDASNSTSSSSQSLPVEMGKGAS